MSPRCVTDYLQRYAVAGLTGLLILSSPRIMVGQYTFLGTLQTHSQTESGLTLTCAPDVQLQIRFLTPRSYRVTLVRPGYEEPLLDYPLVRTVWEDVALQVHEDATQVRVRSSALDLAIDKQPCRITTRTLDGRVISQDDPGMGIGWDGQEVRNWKTIADDEHFFGLGEKTGDVNKRGREFVMWNSDIPGYTDETDPLYQSIPFFVGLRSGHAYGIYLNNSYRTTFNMGAGNHRYYSFAADRGPLDYFFFYGPAISSVVAAYTELTGRMPMPPRWALGYQQCRWSYYPASEVRSIAHSFRDRKIPADVIYLDIHYMDDYRVFTWDDERFPDPEGLLQELEDIGFKVVAIIDPGVKADPDYTIAQEGLAGNHFIRYPDDEVYVGSVWPGRSYFPDFSRAETQDWWGTHLGRLLDQGVDGIWNDMNEPAVWGKAFPSEVIMDDRGRRSSMKKMHNLYGYLMSETAYTGLRHHRPDERPFVLTRAGFAGEQRYTAVWTGDNLATEDHLELGIRMMLGLGISGVAFNGMDVGGFMGTPSPELYARWIQVGTFSPFLRTHTHHGSPDQEPWSFGEPTEDISRTFIELRYRMLPYLYTLFREAHDTGTPVLRPLFWHYQDDPLVYDWWHRHQFLVGEHLLVTPVTRVGERFKKAYLPEGKWIDLNTEIVYEGGQRVTVDAPLERLPMFLNARGILPSQEVVQHTGERSADTIYLDVFPAAEQGEGLLYDDDGASFGYEDGRYRMTRLAYTRRGEGLILTREIEHDRYDPGIRMLVLRFHSVETAPQSVHLGGQALSEADQTSGYAYDAMTKMLTVRFPEAGARQEVVIQ